MRNALMAAVVLALHGCAADPVLLSKTQDMKDFLATDSRLRVIVSSDQGIFSGPGMVEAQRITCTEPSPDVATTLASSFGTGVSLFGRGAASLSAEQVQGLVQLGERTAAIQLLRDKMYQTCLAYSNGAISGTTYSLIMSRLDNAIVTLSLGDGAAGAFGRRLAALSGEATGSADTSVSSLPGDLSKLEEGAGKLAAANKKVDDAAKSLQSHKATKPEAGKETDYATRTQELEKDLSTATAERNALLELLRATASTASKTMAKVTASAGGGLIANPNATVLRDMQSDFLVTDEARDFIFACMVELGLRGDGGPDQALDGITDVLKRKFQKDPSAENRSDYAAAVLRKRSTALAKVCEQRIPDLIRTAAANSHAYRTQRANLYAESATARYKAEIARETTRERELFLDALKACRTEFKDDALRLKACQDRITGYRGEDAAKPAPGKVAAKAAKK